MSISTAPAAPYHCQAHGAGVLTATPDRLNREGAGRWIRQEMARGGYRTIEIKGAKGVVVRLVNDKAHGWFTTKGRVAGVQTDREVSRLAFLARQAA